MIASHPGQVLAWQIRADQPGKITGIFSLTGAHPNEDRFDLIDDCTIRLRGTFPNGLRYEARATIVADGGKLSATDGKLKVDGCDALTVLLAADTNYVRDSRLLFAPDSATTFAKASVDKTAGSPATKGMWSC